MSFILAQNPAKRKHEFRTVVPMKVAIEVNKPRPKPHVCPTCHGEALVEVTGDDGLLYLYDCPNPACRFGYIVDQPRSEHRNWARRALALVGLL